MYLNIVKQEHQNNNNNNNEISENNSIMSVILNETKSTSSGSAKVDCAKECPCGVPAIPVPDQWLEVMVTGGFKVWHIIFIIIAFVVTMVVVYCCFHRCRIPRTKQEIEADLMRSNLANKFRDYLQELPNEPTTFVEALKKVQDIEEKLEADDAQMSRDLGARKRMGWLKLRGKDKPGGEQKPAGEGDPTTTPTGNENEAEKVDESGAGEQTTLAAGNEQPPASAVIQMEPESQPVAVAVAVAESPGDSGKSTGQTGPTKASKGAPNKQTSKKEAAPTVKTKDSEDLAANKAANSSPQGPEVNVDKQPTTSTAPKVKRKRDKPNLSRTKATHLRSHVESMEHNQLELPPPVSHQHHHKHDKDRHHKRTPSPPPPPPEPLAPPTATPTRPAKGKTKARKHSTDPKQTPTNK